ncbi:MAG: 3'-5' exonuclease, partial [Bacillota bacterium]|nr:3'-5' exonuclease [Bacillota bacterium]
DFLYFLDRYEKKINDESVKNTIIDLYRFLMSMPDPWGWADAAHSKDFDADQYLDFAKEYIVSDILYAREYYKQYTKALEDSGLKTEAEKSKDDISFADDLLAEILKDVSSGCKYIAQSKHRVANCGRSDAYLEIKERIKPCRDYAKKCIGDAKKFATLIDKEKLEKEYNLTASVLEICFNLVKKFSDIYAQKKAEENVVDFSDVEHLALKILQNEIARDEYREKFEYVFIDEYQDVNSLQEAIVQSLVRENNLFMVGDVKQSIYQFRLAEPQLFINHYHDYKKLRKSTDKAIDLNTNFRSKASVIDTVNHMFNSLMTETSCGIDYDEDAQLVKGSAYDGDINYPVKLEVLDSDNSEVDEIIAELKNTEKEAAHAVSVIKKYYNSPIYDDKKKCVRNLDYRDMVILLRTAKNRGEIFYKALVDADIPVYFDRGEGFFETIEIEILLNILRIVCNKKQDIPLLSVLSCPIFGFTADELAEIRLAHKDGSFNEAFFDGECQSEKQANFINMLNSLAKDVKAMPLASFINSLMLKTGYMDYCSALNGGDQRLANLKILVDKAGDYEKNNLNGLAGFISFVEMLKSRKNVDMGQAKAISESMNCVRIMTIHKSKGLEFPFVLVAGISSGARRGSKQNSLVTYHKDFGAAIKIVNPAANTFANTSLLTILKAKNEADDRAEAIRLLYVAMTRAKDILVFTAYNKIDENALNEYKMLIPSDRVNASDYFKMVYPLMPHSDIHLLDQGVIASSIAEGVSLSKEFEEKVQNISCEDEKISSIIDYPYFAESNKHKRKYSVSEIAEESRTGIMHKDLVIGDDDIIIACEVPEFAMRGDHKLSATEKGTAYHTVMEHIPFEESYNNIDAIKNLIADLNAKHILSDAESKCVDPKRIKAFFETDIGKRAMKAEKLYKEAPFTMKHHYDDSDVLVQGTIDCYFEEDGELVLVDYKSNYIDLENKEEAYKHLQENYLPQLKLYKEALEKICLKKVKQSALYLFGTGEVIEIKE